MSIAAASGGVVEDVERKQRTSHEPRQRQTAKYSGMKEVRG